jgi:hypothetical protein
VDEAVVDQYNDRAASNVGNDKVWSDGVDAWRHAAHVVWWLAVDLT